jgi:acetaldehyde dehydrogenase/alcohol dehydrogenase
MPQVFWHVEPDPSIESIRAGTRELADFKADVIIALGGGSPMDAAKISE